MCYVLLALVAIAIASSSSGFFVGSRCHVLGGLVYRGGFTFGVYNARELGLLGIAALCLFGSCALRRCAPLLLLPQAACPFGKNSNATAATTTDAATVATTAAAAAAATATSAAPSPFERMRVSVPARVQVKVRVWVWD